MSGTIVNLIIQLIAGAVGGNAAGGLLKNISLGPLGNTVAGAAGGGIGGSILCRDLYLPWAARRAPRAASILVRWPGNWRAAASLALSSPGWSASSKMP
jgi:uncharacterized membrane protein YeaQ/YmgE (transglycosylase-associated protein family)